MKTIRIMLEDENGVFENTENYKIDEAIREVVKKYLDDFYVVEVEIDNDWGATK